MSADIPTVFVVDDDRSVRDSLRRLFTSVGLRRRYDTLTPRERDVMAGVVAGLVNKQIAAEFGTTEATVKEQRGHVMLKMQAGSVAELVRGAGRLRIAPYGGGR